MSNVYQLHSGPKHGDSTFILCPCTEEETLMTPIIQHQQSGPFIASLMCPNCEAVIPVIGGRIQGEAGDMQ